ncbi:hypothetical protein [Alkalihalobacillus sp. 1P02AB]|uniref:hypothetical protein n=1 Tax=Alkalihalobacillus sp. 1P02AB TaxID=3132260 RepID=UPI0039A6F9CA
MKRDDYTPSIQAYLANLIDYAGLFPPANLSLETSIHNFVDYQNDKDAWMLGRFIIPAARLKELVPYLSLFSKEKRLELAVVGQRSTDEASCLNNLRADLEKCSEFLEEFKEVVQINVFEMPLPSSIPSRLLLEEIAIEATKHHVQLFCELTFPLNEEWEQKVEESLRQIASHNETSSLVIGLKLRTGGVTADAFPTPEQVAKVLIGCSEREIPQKFTAGLHHPIRMHRQEVNTHMHGFINIFTASMIARIYQPSLETLIELLSDEESTSFKFLEEGIEWKDTLVKVSEIQRLRQGMVYSYGSCSFDEPREDLRSLQLI